MQYSLIYNLEKIFSPKYKSIFKIRNYYYLVVSYLICISIQKILQQQAL